MEMNTAQYTANGREIRHPAEKLTADGFRELVVDAGLEGESPQERLEAFRRLSIENIADFLDHLNQGLQGSSETLLSGITMKVGEQRVVPVEERYDLFEKIIDLLQHAPKNINPTRIGDSLALATVLLHPFQDGNGRTARMVGYVFQPYFDHPDEMKEDFPYYAGSREGKTGMRPLGYIPHFAPGKDQSAPSDVLEYFHELVYGDSTDLYDGTYTGSKIASPRTISEA